MNSSANRRRARFITFEGIDGAGKSSHLAQTIAFLHRHDVSVVSTREPGGTPLGEQLRETLLHQTMHIETEALLMFAARREHLARVVEPALARGDWVLCDRFSDATYAYQSGGRGLARGKCEQLEQWVHAHLQPDLTLLFDLPSLVAQRRITAQARALDRFERERLDFHERVRRAYLERAAAEPQRIHVIDADQTPEKVQNTLENIVITYCL